MYTCGSSLSPNDDCFIVVREALVCSSPIEARYYGAVLVSFPPLVTTVVWVRNLL